MNRMRISATYSQPLAVGRHVPKSGQPLPVRRRDHEIAGPHVGGHRMRVLRVVGDDRKPQAIWILCSRIRRPTRFSFTGRPDAVPTSRPVRRLSAIAAAMAALLTPTLVGQLGVGRCAFRRQPDHECGMSRRSRVSLTL